MEETWELKARIEALLIASDRAVTVLALAQCLNVTEMIDHSADGGYYICLIGYISY